MADLMPPPCEAAVKATSFLLSAGRRRALSRTAVTESERDHHLIAAEGCLLNAAWWADRITGEVDG